MTTLMIEELEVSQQLLDQNGDFEEALQDGLSSAGDKFGLYEVMLHHGPITPACLATQARISEQLARLWLNVQAGRNRLGHQRNTDLYGLWSHWSPKSQTETR